MQSEARKKNAKIQEFFQLRKTEASYNPMITRGEKKITNGNAACLVSFDDNVEHCFMTLHSNSIFYEWKCKDLNEKKNALITHKKRDDVIVDLYFQSWESCKCDES